MTRILSNSYLLPRSTSTSSIFDNANSYKSTTSADSTTNAKNMDRRECILFPTYACRDPKDPSNWLINIRGWALSHNCSTAKQKMMMSITKSVAGKSSVDSKSSLMFEQRFKYFLATNKRHKPFLIQPVGIMAAYNTSCKGEEMILDSQQPTRLQRPFKNSARMEFDEGHHYSSNHGLIPDNSIYCHAYTPPISSYPSSDEDYYDEDEPCLTTMSAGTINNHPSLLTSFVSPTQGRPTNPISILLDRNSSDQTSSTLQSEQQSPRIRPSIHQHQKIVDSEVSMTLKSRAKLPSFSLAARSNAGLAQAGNDVRQDTLPLLGTRLETQASGFLSGQLIVPHETINQWAQINHQCDTRLIHLQSVCMDNDTNLSRRVAKKSSGSRKFFPTNHGLVNLIEPLGISIISDIDDTIKITEILSGARTVLSKTFFENPLDVPGMSDVYTAWYSQGAAFHYVSNSPFQLMPMLETFLRDSQFPPGSVHLRDDGKLISRLVETPGQAKHNTINKIMMDFPLRQFILVGDSGEIDLEIYTRIALERPEQVLKIYIRDVTTASAIKKRKEKKAQVSAQRQQQIEDLLAQHDSLQQQQQQQQQQGQRKSSGSITSLFSYQKRRFSSQSTLTPRSKASSISMNGIEAHSTGASNNSMDNSTISSNRFSTPVPLATENKRKATKFGSSLKLRKAVARTITEYAIEPHLTGHRSTNQTATLRSSSNDTFSTVSGSEMDEEDKIDSEQQHNTVTSAKQTERNEACSQLRQRVEKAKAKLAAYSIDVVLFEDAEVLQNDTLVQSALWSHWDSQSCE